MSAIKFNYIITIYNKQNLIGQVMESVIKCCKKNSHIYPVLDGCTDNSEKVIDEIILKNPDFKITKVYENNVHELLTINAGLKAANHDGDGYNIILQDDVVFKDYELENKVIQLYIQEGSKLGYVSFRMGANLKSDALTSRDPVPYTDYIENVCGHGLAEAKMLPIGHLTYRTVPIKSPVCIPFKLIREIGMYNEELAPYGHDDIDYAFRVIKNGYSNAVYALEFQSELDWGGTREEGHLVVDSIIERNMDLIRIWHKDNIKMVVSNQQPLKDFKFDKNPSLSIVESKKLWNSKVTRLQKIKYSLSSFTSKLKKLNNKLKKRKEKSLTKQFNESYNLDMSFSETISKYKIRNEVYNYFNHHFYHLLPKELREHKNYIIRNQKGFGEPAFHSMWYKLILEFKPVHVLEIGVYRGQVVSLWTLIGKMLSHKIDVSGVAPFSSFGDSVSEYLKNLDYYQDVQETFEDLKLDKPTFTKGFSSDEIAVNHIKSKSWDMIYIDGGHDYEDALFDYKLCLENLKQGGLIILDDASLYTDYKPLSFSFAGHPGPSLVARMFADKEMDFIGAVGHNNVYKKR